MANEPAPPAPLAPTHEDLVKRLDKLQAELEKLLANGEGGKRVEALEKKIADLEAALAKKASEPAPPPAPKEESPAAPKKKRDALDWCED